MKEAISAAWPIKGNDQIIENMQFNDVLDPCFERVYESGFITLYSEPAPSRCQAAESLDKRIKTLKSLTAPLLPNVLNVTVNVFTLFCVLCYLGLLDDVGKLPAPHEAVFGRDEEEAVTAVQ